MPPIRILALDDEELICEIIDLAFEKKGATVVTALSAEAALDRINEGPAFDAALVDKNLPGMSGLDFIRKVRESDSRMAILMMTGFSSPDSAQEALNLDVDAYLEKPFPKISSVVDRTLEAIEKRRIRLAPAPGAAAAAPATPARAPVKLRVVGVVFEELQDWLVTTVGAEASIAVTRSESEFLRALMEPTDVIVVDGLLFADKVPSLVERAVSLAPLAEVVVLSGSKMSLPSLQKLIDLGVRRLIPQRQHARPLLEVLAAVRKKKQAS